MPTDPIYVKALAPWFGGKRTLAPTIVQQLGPHSQYFDVCCGSMAVLFAKEACQKETVNDLHGGLICLARVVSDELMGPKLYERLDRVVMSESILKEAQHVLSEWQEPRWWLDHPEAGEVGPRRADTNMLEYAFWFMIGSWMGRNGTAGTARQSYQIAVRWRQNGGSPTVRWRHAVESIPAWHRRLQNVVIMRRDLFNVVDRCEDHLQTAIYVDPPYPPEVRRAMSEGSHSRYVHEFHHEGDADDHARLAEILRRYKFARIVVSYYDCPRVRELYDGWTFLDCTMRKNITNATGGSSTAKEAPELLIINGPPIVARAATEKRLF